MLHAILTDMDLALRHSYGPDLRVDQASGLVLSGEHLLFLGHHYPLPVPQDSGPMYMVMIARALTPERRFSLYAYALQHAITDETDAVVHADVTAERDVWFAWYVEGMRAAHVLPGTPDSYVSYSDTHWVWTGRPPRGGSMPSLNIWGMHDVPVHRVLRIWASPLDPIPDNRHPTRNHHLCTDDLCVNPAHTWCKPRSLPLPVAEYLGKRKLTNLPPKQVRYYRSAGQYYCNPHDHPLNPPRERPDGSLPYTVYCAQCYARRRLAIQARVVGRPIEEFRAMEREILDGLDDGTQGPPFSLDIMERTNELYRLMDEQQNSQGQPDI